MDLLIDAAGLWDLVSDKKHQKVIIDCRSFSEYSQGHIPGAINLDTMQFHWIDTTPSGMNTFTEQTMQIFSNLITSHAQTAVFYDYISGPSAARGVWLALYLSHKSVRMLDGGFSKWQEKYPVETKSNPYADPKISFNSDRSIITGKKEIRTASKNNKGIIIDTRSPKEYNGITVRAAHRGHIPGAINIEWKKNLKQDGTFKEREKLAKIYSSMASDSKIITYCQGGYRAAHSFVALKILGFSNVKMYLGSWGEWGNDSQLPYESERKRSKNARQDKQNHPKARTIKNN